MSARYRPKDGNPDFVGATRAEWIATLEELPSWNRYWAERRFDEFVQNGVLVEVYERGT